MTTAHVFIATSLDGFIARPDGDIGWLLERDNPDEDHGYTDFIADKDLIVMGRGSFEKVMTFEPWP
ncbi:dihydrofolate reductase, partial [Acinetobacter baumannii]